MVPFSNDGQPDLCNNGSNVPGNWGLMDFDGVGGNDSKDWVETGYPGQVWAGTPGNPCPDEVNGNSTCYPPQTGELTQVKQELTGRIGDVVQVPIIDYAADAGGSTGEFHVIGFANITIYSLNLTGPDSGRFIEIEFLSAIASGSCCANSGGPVNISVIGQCAVDNRNVGACAP